MTSHDPEKVLDNILSMPFALAGDEDDGSGADVDNVDHDFFLGAKVFFVTRHSLIITLELFIAGLKIQRYACHEDHHIIIKCDDRHIII